MVDVSKIDSYVRTPYGFRNLATGKYASAAEMAAKRVGKLPVPISHYEKVIPNVVENTVKKPSLLKKIAKFGLIGLGISLLGVGGLLLYNKIKNDRAQVNPEPQPLPKPQPKPEPKPTPKPAPVPESKKYIVKEGDNLWNIAKQYLIDQHSDNPNYKPTNKEILEKTEELIKLNNKDYKQPLPSDSRKRVVIINKGEEINLD